MTESTLVGWVDAEPSQPFRTSKRSFSLHVESSGGHTVVTCIRTRFYGVNKNGEKRARCVQSTGLFCLTLVPNDVVRMYRLHEKRILPTDTVAIL